QGRPDSVWTAIAARAGPAGRSGVATTGVFSDRRSASSRSATSRSGLLRGLNMPAVSAAAESRLRLARMQAGGEARARRGLSRRTRTEAPRAGALSPPRFADTLTWPRRIPDLVHRPGFARSAAE